MPTRRSSSTTRRTAPGGGIKAITDGTVDFGASDAPMKDEEIAALPADCKVLHIPTALGAVVVIYNLPGVASVNLDADNVAGIYLGTIKKWNDPAIAANNAGVTLPDTDILVAHRSDGSGTTNAFTTYLDTVSPDWHSKVGKGKEVNWPTGVGAQGNDGVAGAVKQTPGAVGYVELNYATQTGLTSANLKNADGQFVPGSTDGVTAAAEAAVADFPADFRQAPIINGAGRDDLPGRVVHLPAHLHRPEGRREGAGPRRVHLLGAQRRPGARERPRLCAVACRGPAEGHRRAAQDHHRRCSCLALIDFLL